MLDYIIETGRMYLDGVLIGLCYAGNSTGLDNPDMVNMHNVGPLPPGIYSLVDIIPFLQAELEKTADSLVAQQIQQRLIAEKRMGPIVFVLNPDPANEMFDRSGFRLHWDTPAATFTASDGCIVAVMSILFTRVRNALTAQPDLKLRVFKSEADRLAA